MSGSQALQLATAIDRKYVALVLLLEPPVERFLRVELPRNALLVDNIYLVVLPWYQPRVNLNAPSN